MNCCILLQMYCSHRRIYHWATSAMPPFELRKKSSVWQKMRLGGGVGAPPSEILNTPLTVVLLRMRERFSVAMRHACTGVVGYRTCSASGEWLSDKTDYSQCFQFPALPPQLDHIDSNQSLHLQAQQPIPNLGTWTQVG